MKKTPVILALFGAMVAAAALAPTAAQASLGESRDSIDRDVQALSGTRGAVTQRAAYSIENLNTPKGAVREYVDTKGTVFAVAWQGSSHPDLTALLSSYNDEYVSNMSRHHKRKGRRKQTLTTAHMLIERAGHMRAVRGRVFDPSLVPPGVNTNELN